MSGWVSRAIEWRRTPKGTSAQGRRWERSFSAQKSTRMNLTTRIEPSGFDLRFIGRPLLAVGALKSPRAARTQRRSFAPLSIVSVEFGTAPFDKLPVFLDQLDRPFRTPSRMASRPRALRPVRGEAISAPRYASGVLGLGSRRPVAWTDVFSSATEFECHAGNIMAGVALKGTYAK